VYSLIDYLGDLGGLIEIIYFFCVALLRPISYHSYILKATKKLFTARTRHSNLFKPPKKILKGDQHQKQIQLSALIGQHFRPNAVSQKLIHLRLRDSLLLFVVNKISFIKRCIPKVNPYVKIFKEGEKRIQSQMNVMKMVKDLMNVKIITESKLMTPDLLRKLKVHEDKLIDIDSESIVGD
jgi:hypothetical protein